MDATFDLALARALRPATASPATAVTAEPARCKGPACPAFALCQGRCATKRLALQTETQPAH